MKKVLILLILLGFMSSCSDFTDWNVDKKNPSEVSAEALVTNAEETLATRMASTSVNYNIFKMLAQYWTETTYTDEANYDMVNRNVGGNFWTNIYTSLNDLEDAKKIVNNDGSLDAVTKDNKLAIIDLMEVYYFHVLVDTFGDVPYSEALDINNLLPKYDDDQAIYNDLFDRITADVNKLSNGGTSFGTADIFYNGDVDLWKKFGNSLKLRMAVRIDDVDHAKAVAMASEAVASGVISSNSENFEFHFLSSPPHTNPLWNSLVQSGRHDFVVTNTFVDVISPLNDPRAPFFMDDNLAPNPYDGGIYGDNNAYDDYTHIGAAYHVEDNPYIVLGYDEVEFLLAEAAERTLVGAPADAEGHYNAAITASMEYWSIPAADITAYLAQPSVAYASAAATWQEKIGVQKWIALYARGFESWSSWRSLGYPAMNLPAISGLPVPRRYIYPQSEPNVNGDNYEAASAAMGGDEMTSRVFWDQ
jgi:hypothetical protein